MTPASAACPCPPRGEQTLTSLSPPLLQSSPADLAAAWPPRYRAAVRALLCAAHRSRARAAEQAAAATVAVAAEAEAVEEAGISPPGTSLSGEQSLSLPSPLLLLPPELLLRVAALAAAPLSAW